MQALLMYTPLHVFFKIVPLGINEIGALLAGGTVFYAAYLLYEVLAKGVGKKTSVLPDSSG